MALHDGDAVAFAGGGDSTEESGIQGADWVLRMNWVGPPDPSCPLDERRSVGEVVIGQ